MVIAVGSIYVYRSWFLVGSDFCKHMWNCSFFLRVSLVIFQKVLKTVIVSHYTFNNRFVRSFVHHSSDNSQSMCFVFLLHSFVYGFYY